MLKNQFSPNIKRIIVPGIPVFSLLIFLFKKNIPQEVQKIEAPQIVLDVITIIPNSELLSTKSYFTFNNLYFTGILISSFAFAFSFIQLKKIHARSRKTQSLKNIQITESSVDQNFSFFNWIHLNNELTNEEKNIILEHEMIHVDQKHSYEVIYFELLKIIFWFNPIIYLLKNEIEHIHEEEVDKIMHQSHGEQYIYSILGFSLKTKAEQLKLSNQFINKKYNLKTRIKMITTKRKNQMAWLIALPLLGSVLAFTNTNTSKNIPVSKTTSIISDTTKAEYKGGMKALYKFMGENIKYPESAKKENIEGKVFVQFTVNKKGLVKNAIALNEADERLKAEAIRVISSMTDWIPATANGEKISTKMTLPILFKLTDEN